MKQISQFELLLEQLAEMQAKKPVHSTGGLNSSAQAGKTHIHKCIWESQ